MTDSGKAGWGEAFRNASAEDLPPSFRDRSMRARFSRLALGLLLDALGTIWIRVRPVDMEHVPESGSCLVCSNHVSFLDGPAFAKALRGRRKRSFAALGSDRYFSGGIKGVIAAAFRVLPTNPGRNIRGTLRCAAAALNEGAALYIAPEGGL